MKPACHQLDAARASGAPRYFTGLPCKHGHIAERLTNSSTCVECNRVIQAKSILKRKEKILAWFDANRDALRAKHKAYDTANRAQKRASNRDWADKNPQKVQASRDAWTKGNPEYVYAYRLQRRTASRRALPDWADRKQIALIYRQARVETRRTGTPMHVDHIVPLQSRVVCGLHNEFNLQLLPQSANQSKGNRWWPDMPEAVNG